MARHALIRCPFDKLWWTWLLIAHCTVQDFETDAVWHEESSSYSGALSSTLGNENLAFQWQLYVSAALILPSISRSPVAVLLKMLTPSWNCWKLPLTTASNMNACKCGIFLPVQDLKMKEFCEDSFIFQYLIKFVASKREVYAVACTVNHHGCHASHCCSQIHDAARQRSSIVSSTHFISGLWHSHHLFHINQSSRAFLLQLEFVGFTC